MKLNLGCGDKLMEGYINMDIRDFGQEIVRDVRRGIPFNNDTFDEVYTCHFMEHIGHEDIYFVMEEMYRVLKHGGTLVIRVPHSSSDEAFYPDHVSFWNQKMVYALLNDPQQAYGDYQFRVETMSHSGIELRVVMTAVK